jgi:hypothetical protein
MKEKLAFIENIILNGSSATGQQMLHLCAAFNE